jgi:hypothetical protein
MEQIAFHIFLASVWISAALLVSAVTAILLKFVYVTVMNK